MTDKIPEATVVDKIVLYELTGVPGKFEKISATDAAGDSNAVRGRIVSHNRKIRILFAGH